MSGLQIQISFEITSPPRRLSFGAGNDRLLINMVHINYWLVLFAFLSTIIACQPVIAVGWNEFLFVFLLIAALLGQPLYKFIRRLEKRFKHKQQSLT